MPDTGTELSIHENGAIVAANFQILPPELRIRQQILFPALRRKKHSRKEIPDTVLVRSGPKSGRILSAAPPEKDFCGANFPVPIGNLASVRRYVQGLAHCCGEVAGDLHLLPVLLGVLRLAPKTIAELARRRAGEKQSPFPRGHPGK
jgi:hypothetical protein